MESIENRFLKRKLESELFSRNRLNSLKLSVTWARDSVTSKNRRQATRKASANESNPTQQALANQSTRIQKLAKKAGY